MGRRMKVSGVLPFPLRGYSRLRKKNVKRLGDWGKKVARGVRT